MPLIALATLSYIAGLFAGFAGVAGVATLTGAGVAAGALATRRQFTAVACGIILATGAIVAHDARAADARIANAANAATLAQPADESILGRWRNYAGASIDTLFGSEAPVVRALLIADTKQLPADVRDRYARAGLVHLLAISGLHVAIISGAVLLLLQMLRVGRRTARWLAVGITLTYVAAIGAPPPALRSGAMLAAMTLGWALQRPVSPWATLSLGALVPVLVDPRAALAVGYQLSVVGFASITAAGIWTRRMIPHDLRGWRRKLLTDFAVSSVAAFASAPLVAWYFARVSLIAPVSNLFAGPVVAVMQPSLFLAMVLAPLGAPARIVASGARVLVRTLDFIASTAASVPGGALTVAPSLAVAALGAAASGCALAAAAAKRNRARWLAAALGAVALIAWWPAIPGGPRGMEIHLIDVGQGDAIAIRSPRGRWIVVDAGGGRTMGDAGRRIVVPYLRRLGGDVAMFVMTHPHEDHVGGAAALITLLRPGDVRDAAFAGTSASYREALVAARDRGVPWHRIHPGDSANVDGIVVTFLAPDSAWTASLSDPNLASAMMLVRYGQVRALFTGDAEAPEEAWLLQHAATALGADVLKVGHHGSSTSTTSGLIAAVHPRLALVSVGLHNRYHHPSAGVLDSLAAHGAAIARTDAFGTVVVRTDVAGTRFTVSTARGVPIPGIAPTGVAAARDTGRNR